MVDKMELLNNTINSIEHGYFELFVFENINPALDMVGLDGSELFVVHNDMDYNVLVWKHPDHGDIALYTMECVDIFENVDDSLESMHTLMEHAKMVHKHIK